MLLPNAGLVFISCKRDPGARWAEFIDPTSYNSTMGEVLQTALRGFPNSAVVRCISLFLSIWNPGCICGRRGTWQCKRERKYRHKYPPFSYSRWRIVWIMGVTSIKLQTISEVFWKLYNEVLLLSHFIHPILQGNLINCFQHSMKGPQIYFSFDWLSLFVAILQTNLQHYSTEGNIVRK